MIRWRWDGEALRPLTNRPLPLEPGETYLLEAIEERSRASHAHYFARITDLWESLPEHLASEPWATTPEFLRHYALIHEGFAHCQAYPCASAAEARRWLSILPRPRGEDGQPVFSIRKIEGSTLYEFTPETQKMRGNGGMGKARFQESKDKVLGFLEHLVGVDGAKPERADV